MTHQRVKKKTVEKVKLVTFAKYKEYSVYLFFIVTIIFLAFFPKPKSTHSPSPSPKPSFVPVTYNIPSPSPSSSPKNLKKETILRENSDKTLAYYYTADTPVFSSTGLTSNGQQNEDDPFKLMFNGDASYFTKSAANKGWGNSGNPLTSDNYTAIIKPMVIDLKNNSKRELKSVDKGMIVGNGYTQVLQWVDNSSLFSRSCGEAVGCDLDIINAQDDTLTPYASTNMTGYDSFTTKSRVKNYTLVQSCDNARPCDIKIYKDLPIKNSNYFSFDLSSYNPISTIKTTKYLNNFSLDDDNIATLNQRAKFYLSDQSPYNQKSKVVGFFIFDLVTGTFIEGSNL